MVYFGEGQDHFANELALGHRQLEEGLKNIRIFVTNPAVPTGATLFYQMTGCAAVTELLDRHTLAYRLYTLCERNSWAEDARSYNELVTAWMGIEQAANEAGIAGSRASLEL